MFASYPRHEVVDAKGLMMLKLRMLQKVFDLGRMNVLYRILK